MEIARWFRGFDGFSEVRDDPQTQYTLEQLILGTDKTEIEEFLRELDVNLDHIELKFPGGGPMPDTDEAGVRIVSDKRKSLINRQRSSETHPVEVAMTAPKRNERGVVVGQVELDLARHGSQGTNRLFALAGPLVDTLKHGKILFVDEFDARLHPTMSCALVKLFNSPKTNPHNAQLVFATHDTNLLSHRLLRRDQIWFAEKNEQGATHLYSLAQFRLENGELPRKDSSFENDYINGKFGAVPFLGDLGAIFRREAQSTQPTEAALHGQI